MYMDVNVLWFNCVLSPSTHGSGKLSDPTSLVLTTRLAQVHVGLTSCQAQHP
jgi:hypothetical protein